MKKKWVLSQEAFDALLNWLDSDREQAGIKYEAIRQSLIKFFVARCCADAEDLADETINRVADRLPEIRKNFTGDPRRYFHGVANNVLKEYQRKQQPSPPPVPPDDSDRKEQEYRCLEGCIARLNSKDRELLLQYYYPEEGRSLSEQRKLLAEKLGIALNALRIKAYRIREGLKKCVEKCIERSFE